MGNSEEVKSPKPEKSATPTVDQNNIHMYPDWSAMQAYYGPHVAVPPPYLSAAAPGHAPPPYMWGPPQSMIPPYGSPYAAFYAHGGVYAHHGVHPSTGVEPPVESYDNTGGGFVKKLKEFDGLAMSLGNQNSDSAEDTTNPRNSQSEETEGSSDGSNAGQNGKKRNRQGSPCSAGDGKVQKLSKNTVAVARVGEDSEKMIVVIPPVKKMENTNTELELNDTSDGNNTSPTNVVRTPQNERDLKRERRKQSNRESARRSRLRKQAEAEELAVKVQALTAENTALKSEMNKIMGGYEKMKMENDALMEKLKETEARTLQNNGDFRLNKPISTVNLLARVNNSDSNDTVNENIDSCENTSPGAKLHQLMDTKPRTDAVAA